MCRTFAPDLIIHINFSVMKKFVLLVVLFSVSMFANAYNPSYTASKHHFGWNKSIQASLGYDHLYSTFASDWYGHESPTDLMQVDITMFGIYFSAGFWEKNTGYSVYGYDERISTFVFKLGPSLRYRFADDKMKLVFTPYFGWGKCTLDDRSNNAIGQRQDYGDIGKTIFMGGIKLGLVYKYVEFGINASNREVGVNLGVNIDFD